jgi:alpha-D-xyloside xylohydrolase
VKTLRIALFSSLILILSHAGYSQELDNYLNHQLQGRSVLIESVSGQTIRITPYGDEMLRVQIAEKGQAFTPDDRYEMVLSHDWPGTLQISENEQALDISAAGSDGYRLRISKKPLRFTWFRQGKPVLAEKRGLVWEKRPESQSSKSNRKSNKRERESKKYIRTITLDYQLEPGEHFAGSGGPDKEYLRPLDLRGHRVLNEYPAGNGRSFIPFYVSSKGYGLFINSSFSTEFNFGVKGRYQISLLNRTQANFAMDYFFIAGSNLMSVVQNYTELTGRPRLFPRAFLGLQLTDRGAHLPPRKETHQDTWKHTVSSLREQGYPFDVAIFDNLWRAGGGGMASSRFEWDLNLFPDPAEFGRYARKEGVMIGLDLNRQINQISKGWKPEYGMPDLPGVDYTNPQARKWTRELIFGEGLGPDGNYPMDAIWVDGTDNMKGAFDQKLHNGWTWDEAKNYYPFLIGKTFVDEGWDKIVGEKQRPYVWMRSGFAGVQRQMIHWTGDIKSNEEMFKQQVINLQASGISGFAYFNHDAGGFGGYPSEELYRQWTCAFASFTPIWRPHGQSKGNPPPWKGKSKEELSEIRLYCVGSRRPDTRSEETQKDFRKYAQTRYEMIPYIYTYAHEATATGTPMARAMFLEFDDEKAWKFPLQYMWGRQLLVAPNVKPGQNKEVWLPKGLWYDFWTKQPVDGNQVMNLNVPVGQMPVFAKAGSIITRAPYALSTKFIPKDKLMIDVYLGADGQFTLVEDDNISEKFRKGELQKTKMELKNEQRQFTVHAAQGTYDGAVNKKDYVITLYGLSDKPQLTVNGKDNKSAVWKESGRSLSITLPQQSIKKAITLSW